MKKTVLAAALAALAISPAALAENYQMEAGLGFTSYDYDGGGSDSAISLDFKYHFEQVETADRPLNEAAFLGRNGNVNLQYVTVDKADFDVISLGAEAWFDAFWVAANVDLNQMPSGDDNTTDFGVAAGYMVDENWRVHLGFDVEDGGDFDDINYISIGTKYVGLLDGGAAYNIEANIAKADDDDDTIGYRLAGDYYFTSAISAGLSYEDTDDSDSEATIGINGKYFVTPLISVEAEYTTTKDYVDTIGLRAAMRF